MNRDENLPSGRCRIYGSGDVALHRSLRPARTMPGWRVLLVGGLLALASGEPGRAASLVAPGDVLRVSVAEAPDLDREARVDADGRIMLPQIGGVSVAGLDLDGARVRIEAAIAEHDLVRAATVLVEIASYRPFYVGGVVANPGAVPFSPGLTARHAIILAGGIDRTQGPERLSATDLLDLRAKWKGNAFSLIQVESRITRLRAELDGLEALDFSSFGGDAPETADTEAILEIETGLFKDRVTQSRSSREHLQTGLALADLEIDVLGKQADLELREEKIQNDQVERTMTLLDKGLVPASRLQELERQKSRISRDLLDNRAYAARARQSKETIRYELDVAEVKRRIDVRGELAAAIGERSRLQAESGVLASALMAAGIAITEAGASEAVDPEVTLYRIVNGKPVIVAATVDTEIFAGDVLQVSIPRQQRR